MASLLIARQSRTPCQTYAKEDSQTRRQRIERTDDEVQDAEREGISMVAVMRFYVLLRIHRRKQNRNQYTARLEGML